MNYHEVPELKSLRAELEKLRAELTISQAEVAALRDRIIECELDDVFGTTDQPPVPHEFR